MSAVQYENRRLCVWRWCWQGWIGVYGWMVGPPPFSFDLCVISGTGFLLSLGCSSFLYPPPPSLSTYSIKHLGPAHLYVQSPPLGGGYATNASKLSRMTKRHRTNIQQAPSMCRVHRLRGFLQLREGQCWSTSGFLVQGKVRSSWVLSVKLREKEALLSEITTFLLSLCGLSSMMLIPERGLFFSVCI